MSPRFRLSPPQRHLWTLARQASDQAFCAAGEIGIEGLLDPAKLEDVLVRLVARHEILRTTFTPGDDPYPEQAVGPVRVPPLVHHDLSTSADPERGLDSLWREILASPFDLSQAPLLRAQLARTASDRFVLGLALPSLCADGRSLEILFGEIACLLAGEELPEGDDGPMQHADVSEWLNELLESEDGAAGREWWRRRPAPELDVPVIAPLKPGAPFRVEASMARLERSEAPGDDAGLGAAFAALLSRLSRVTDIPIALRADGRPHPELRGAVGPLDRPLPLTLAVSPEATLAELSAETRRALEEAQEWQSTFSWDAWDDPHRRLAASLPIALEAHRRPSRRETRSALLSLRRRTAALDRFALRLWTERDVDGIDLRLDFDPSRVAREAAERILRGLVALLSGVVRRDAPIRSLSVVPERERQRLVEGSAEAVTAEDRRCLHHLFEERTRATPDAPALVFQGVTVSYTELDAQAERLARRLRALGSGPETLVALSVPRSTEMLVGIFGILKAGAAYLPLDPSYPRERLQLMLDDSAAPVLVTVKALEGKLRSAAIVCIDAESAEPETASPIVPASPEHAAYVIYTSGSTGRPKGVVVTHANAVASTSARARVYPGRPDRFLLLSSFSFDSSIAGIFGTLCRGGTLVLPPDRTELDAREVARFCFKQRVTHTLCIPSLWRLVLEHAEPGHLESLRVVIVAGEACPPSVAEIHHAVLPETALYNEYGPTEAAVWCTVHPISAGEPTIPIGRAIPGARVFILDEWLEPLPIGFPGELCVGGAGVARGYFGRASATAEKFVPDPFASSPGARLYRTGDLARIRDDGALDFLGRVDQQVKIRGHRIEIEEIETVLAGHPDVAELAIADRPRDSGDRWLVAYVVPREGGAAPTVADLRRFLLEKIPDYMVPEAFVLLDELPRVPNGKVDRRALPEPESDRPELDVAYVAPRTELERLLADRFRDVLEVEEIGVHDSFFEIGGNSLRAAVLVNKLREILGDGLHVATLFEYPRIADLAAFLEESRPRSDADAARPVGPRRATRGDEEVLSRIDELSDEEVRARLGELLKEEADE